jgi:hypothetical protein
MAGFQPLAGTVQVRRDMHFNACALALDFLDRPLRKQWIIFYQQNVKNVYDT